ncbi:putative Heterokaryon incompatibility protein 6, OR allele [Seiridium cardinale]
MKPEAYKYRSLTSPASDGFSIRVLELDPASTACDKLAGTLAEIRVDKDYEMSWLRHTVRISQRLPERQSENPTTIHGRPMKALPRRRVPISFPPDAELANEWRYHEALSYTWGDPANRFDDVLFLDQAPLRISKNLSEALRRFRIPDRPRRLWVDAVCINQDDIPERNDQVARMHLIYRYASRVLIWLGEDSSVEDGAMSFKFLQWSQAQPVKSVHDLLAQFNMAYNPCQGDLTPEIIRQFFARPWFSRRWIVQEALQDSMSGIVQMHCGEFSVGWNTFATAMLDWAVREPEFRDSFPVQLAQGSSNARSSHTIWAIVHFQQFGCQDPRDCIAALLNLRRVPDSSPFRVDYAKTIEDNYIDFAISLAGRGKCEPLLLCAARRRCQSSEHVQRKMPSWVPDWRIMEPALSQAKFSTGTKVTVSGTVHERAVLALEGRILRKFTGEVEVKNDSIVWQSLRADCLRPIQGDIVFQAGVDSDPHWYFGQLVLRPAGPTNEPTANMTKYTIVTEYIHEEWGRITEAVDDGLHVISLV